ncbi:MAG: hypothetical protein LBF34_03650 [Puniceicoccales bacterium]|jgi:hypothetical protein|nr:hypothetical protein [Puniceicoccales bacterium]
MDEEEDVIDVNLFGFDSETDENENLDSFADKMNDAAANTETQNTGDIY